MCSPNLINIPVLAQTQSPSVRNSETKNWVRVLYAYRQNLIAGFEDLFKDQGAFMLNVLTLELADSGSILPEVPEQQHHTFLLSHMTDIWRRVFESSTFPEGQEIFLCETFKKSPGWWLWHSHKRMKPGFSLRLWKPQQNQRICAHLHKHIY